METDRPDQTESPFIVKKGYFQLESGFNKNYISSEVEYFLPTTLMKLGLNKKFEFRYLSVLNSFSNIIRFKNEAVGFKFFIFEEKGILPKTSIIAHYHLGYLKRDLTDLNRTAHSVGDAVFTSQHQLSNTFSIAYNYGTSMMILSLILVLVEVSSKVGIIILPSDFLTDSIFWDRLLQKNFIKPSTPYTMLKNDKNI